MSRVNVPLNFDFDPRIFWSTTEELIQDLATLAAAKATGGVLEVSTQPPGDTNKYHGLIFSVKPQNG